MAAFRVRGNRCLEPTPIQRGEKSTGNANPLLDLRGVNYPLDSHGDPAVATAQAKYDKDAVVS